MVVYGELGVGVGRCSGLLENDGGLMFEGGLELWSWSSQPYLWRSAMTLQTRGRSG